MQPYLLKLFTILLFLLLLKTYTVAELAAWPATSYSPLIENMLNSGRNGLLPLGGLPPLPPPPGTIVDPAFAVLPPTTL
ncbi:hypothetical protein Mgra_00003665 [Meloidogyne graminicola]|uniref:Uncharacterized protein n=1 Tax=Meloidogyne graminicola TaxID=189291 RepID=A0A8S9ZUH4_9BILA|nr:hypothetical protein Mgra_00003665 [Meloidogyne graminicola]